jgi:hypothetical protein
MDLTNFVLNPLTLAILVMGVVQFIKDLGLRGNVLRLVSLALGILLAFAFKSREIWPAAAVYIDYAFFSLAVGLGACGIYSLIHDHMPLREPAPGKEGNQVTRD